MWIIYKRENEKEYVPTSQGKQVCVFSSKKKKAEVLVRQKRRQHGRVSSARQ